MTTYNSALDTVRKIKAKHGDSWATISPENAARIAMQNRFKTGLDIARYTASIMRKDMAATKNDCSKKTQKDNKQNLFIPFGLDGSCFTF